ncbi:hypothetical protein ccbrp13_65410 [Ktedonobacteria bacterium brp13]|nr:hypothetical protein ccbrp13_65410 [Ktedonobacteria bacterium brp13]
MPTQEERLAALEQKVTDIELERLYEKRKAPQLSSDQLYDAGQVNHRLTMLLGVASGQETSIKVIESDLGVIKEQLSGMKQDNAAFHVKFDRLETRFDGLENRFDRLEKLLLDRLPAA